MESSQSYPVAPVDEFSPVAKVKKAKSKKHKKHHKHSKESTDPDAVLATAVSLSQGGPAAAAASGALKIRIRVGSGGGGLSAPDDVVHLKKKKKKDKKKKDKEKRRRHHKKERRKREREEELEDAVTSVGDGIPGPEAKMPALETVVKDEVVAEPSGATCAGDSEDKENRSDEITELGRSGTGDEKTARLSDKPLFKLLSSILPRLEKMDPNKFFAMPVSDKFAPGYSQIIKQPMDFSTMRGKLLRGDYCKLNLFKEDFELMCNNAMTYNTQDTIYYKTAKKLRAVGKGLLTPQRLISMREHFSFMEDLSEEELGFDLNAAANDDRDDDEDEEDDEDDAKDVSKVIEDIREVVRRPPGRFEAIPDDLTSQEILEQARQAAKAAADKLKLHKPSSQMGFIRQNKDGSTSLNFLIGGDGIIPGTARDRPVSLGALIGKVKQGTGAIGGFREDRRNAAKTVHPLYYGAFSSHGPCYDSTFANLTKEETDLVASTYGDDVGVQYAESILNFSRNCDYAMFIVDHLLDILTGNEHRKTSKYIEEQKNLRKEDELMEEAFKQLKPLPETSSENRQDKEEAEVKNEGEEDTKIDFEALKSLSEDGIDMSFLDHLKSEWEKVSETTSDKLSRTAALLEELHNTQDARLARAPPAHFAHMAGPTEHECDLAAKVRQELSGMARGLKPEDVVPANGVKRLLGLPEGTDGDDGDSMEEESSSAPAPLSVEEETPQQASSEPMEVEESGASSQLQVQPPAATVQ